MTQFENKCSKCGHSPKTRNGTAGKCPSCSGICPFEVDSDREIAEHQSKVHWYF